MSSKVYLVMSFKRDPYIYKLTSNNSIRTDSNNSISSNSNNNTNSTILIFVSNKLDYITRIVVISKGSSRRVLSKGSNRGRIYILATIHCIYTKKVSIV